MKYAWAVLALFALSTQAQTSGLIPAPVEQAAAPAADADERIFSGQVLVKIDGMSCPFCVYGLEKRLRKTPGIESARVSFRAGTALLTVKPAATVTERQIREVVKKAGFKVAEIKPIEKLKGAP